MAAVAATPSKTNKGMATRRRARQMISALCRRRDASAGSGSCANERPQIHFQKSALQFAFLTVLAVVNRK